MKKLILIAVAIVVLVNANEGEDVEQKKRGAGKASNLNALPTGAQKPDFTYSIYPQNPNAQNSPTYQAQIHNSLPYSYTQQTANQYYTSANPSTDVSSGYSQQPHMNIIPAPTSSHFIPFGYQNKYQIVPPKVLNGNIQLAVLQHPFHSSSIIPYQQQLFSPTTNQVSPPHGLIGQFPSQSNFNIPSFQPLSVGAPYITHPSNMVLVPHPSTSMYNNILYPNPLQSHFNYYMPPSSAKYIPYIPSPSSIDYDKGIQGSIPQSVPKEENDINVNNNDYLSSSDAPSGYKSGFVPSRSSSYNKS